MKKEKQQKREKHEGLKEIQNDLFDAQRYLLKSIEKDLFKGIKKENGLERAVQRMEEREKEIQEFRKRFEELGFQEG